MSVLAAAEPYYDPYDYEVDANAHPIWKRLRDEAPVYWNEKYGFYALSRFDDVLPAMLDTSTFSSAHMTVLEMMTDEANSGGMMIFMDPPEHNHLRKLVSRAFTPRAIGGLEDRCGGCARSTSTGSWARRASTTSTSSAALLPPTVILALMGFPEGHVGEWRQGIDQMFHMEEGDKGFVEQGGRRRNAETVLDDTGQIGAGLFQMLPDLIAERRREPQDDLISVLANSDLEEEDGTTRKLTDPEIFSFMHAASIAGTETVARLLSWAAVLLARNPDQRQVLVDDPGADPQRDRGDAALRGAVAGERALGNRDVEFHGQTIPAGSKLMLLNGSGDRDERHFADPDVYDVRRRIDRHVAFGYGAHFCVGAALARIESRIAIEETLKRFPRGRSTTPSSSGCTPAPCAATPRCRSTSADRPDVQPASEDRDVTGSGDAGSATEHLAARSPRRRREPVALLTIEPDDPGDPVELGVQVGPEDPGVVRGDDHPHAAFEEPVHGVVVLVDESRDAAVRRRAHLDHGTRCAHPLHRVVLTSSHLVEARRVVHDLHDVLGTCRLQRAELGLDRPRSTATPCRASPSAWARSYRSWSRRSSTDSVRRCAPKAAGSTPKRDGVTETVTPHLGCFLHPPDGALEALVGEALAHVVEPRERTVGVPHVEVGDHGVELGLRLRRIALLDEAEVDGGDRVPPGARARRSTISHDGHGSSRGRDTASRSTRSVPSVAAYVAISARSTVSPASSTRLRPIITRCSAYCTPWGRCSTRDAAEWASISSIEMGQTLMIARSQRRELTAVDQEIELRLEPREVPGVVVAEHEQRLEVPGGGDVSGAVALEQLAEWRPHPIGRFHRRFVAIPRERS